MVVVVTGAGGGLGERIAKDVAGLARVAAELGDDRVLTQASHERGRDVDSFRRRFKCTLHGIVTNEV
jgi:NAD(P)-dependent dehydrogenase (short-subunit alcohol dehydrogenase family)